MTDADVSLILFVAFVALCVGAMTWVNVRYWRARRRMSEDERKDDDDRDRRDGQLW